MNIFKNDSDLLEILGQKPKRPLNKLSSPPTEDELKERGVNISHTHVDFMFGSSCMNIVGTKKDGTKVVIFKDGNFVI